MENTKPLFKPIKMGAYEFENRIAMAALTRCRADIKTGIPTEMHVQYYSERAKDTAFILTECASICPRSNAFPGACGIYSDSQVEGWRQVTEAVHKVNGRIFLQIWHCGRAGLKTLLDADPLAPSAIKNRHKARLNRDFVESDTPLEMTVEDIDNVIEEFRIGAKNAKLAGFDGVELHGANGYLVDSFLRDATNTRTDNYGGSPENRCRFALQVMDVLIEVFGADKVGIKISPLGRLNDMFDSNPIETYSYLLKELSKRNVSFVEIMKAPEFRPVPNLYDIPGEEQVEDIFTALKPFFNGVLIANNSLNYETASKLIEEKTADMVTFGRLFIANPDLVERFKNNYQLNIPDEKSFYTPGKEGYIDYPIYKS